MSRYEQLQREFVEHNNAADQKDVVTPFLVSFAEELARYLDCPHAALRFVGKDRALREFPQDTIRFSPNGVWILDIRLSPLVSGSQATGTFWEVGVAIRKKWDSFHVRAYVGGIAGTGAKNVKIQEDAVAAGISEMCEWVFNQLMSYYQEYDFFRR